MNVCLKMLSENLELTLSKALNTFMNLVLCSQISLLLRYSKLCLPSRLGTLVSNSQYMHYSGSNLWFCMQILLDGPGTLKYSNFCLAKAEGESLEEFFALVLSAETETGDSKEMALSKNIKNRIQGNT